MTQVHFHKRFKPLNLNEIIILPRIRKIIETNKSDHLLFYGTPGIGKTTLADIISSDYSTYVANSKLGVNTLRNEIETFCARMSFAEEKTDKMVYLEEFDGASSQMQDELRAFIDKFNMVRFIATCNNIDKIISPIQSRFYIIDFTPKTVDEIKYLKTHFAKRLLYLNETFDLKVSKSNILEIIKRDFPDFRKIIQSFQISHLTNNTQIDPNVSIDKEELYFMIHNKTSSIDVWNTLMSKWIDRLDIAFKLLGRDWWIWAQNNNYDMDKMSARIIKVSEYTDQRLPWSKDPLITLYSLIIELQKI